ncbi:hypothetical protein A6R68_08389 [Neotoma lepida]|uniref:Small ribosomal subunit protein eS6 n=1 Tax=Neotoma lepida TaxID=56216 RepID=A0A1A6G2R4_NEOLE|nr:hypothetical protein A6R68_08389 [Neotoma lepida]
MFFFMKQGVLTCGVVSLLLSKRNSYYRPRGTTDRNPKSVHGCIVDANLSVFYLVIGKNGGMQRARRIQNLFHLSKEDDVHQYIVRKPLNKEGKKFRTKAPKIQHLVTPHVLAQTLKKQCTKKNTEEVAKLLAKKMKKAKDKYQEQIAKRRRLFLLRASTSEFSDK